MTIKTIRVIKRDGKPASAFRHSSGANNGNGHYERLENPSVHLSNLNPESLTRIENPGIKTPVLLSDAERQVKISLLVDKGLNAHLNGRERVNLKRDAERLRREHGFTAFNKASKRITPYGSIASNHNSVLAIDAKTGELLSGRVERQTVEDVLAQGYVDPAMTKLVIYRCTKCKAYASRRFNKLLRAIQKTDISKPLSKLGTTAYGKRIVKGTFCSLKVRNPDTKTLVFCRGEFAETVRYIAESNPPKNRVPSSRVGVQGDDGAEREVLPYTVRERFETFGKYWSYTVVETDTGREVSIPRRCRITTLALCKAMNNNRIASDSDISE